MTFWTVAVEVVANVNVQISWQRYRIPENGDAGGAIAEAAVDQFRAESRGADLRHPGPREE